MPATRILGLARAGAKRAIGALPPPLDRAVGAVARRVWNRVAHGGKPPYVLPQVPAFANARQAGKWWLDEGVGASERGHPVEALECLRRAALADPGNWEVHRHYAIELMQGFGDLDASMGEFRRARRIRRVAAAALGFSNANLRFMDHFWSAQIGHTANLEPYVKRDIMLGRGREQTILYLPPGSKIANPCLLEHFSKFVTIVREESQLPRKLPEMELLQEDYYLLDYPDGEETHWWIAGARIVKRWEDENRGPLLALSAEEKARGDAARRALGIPDGAWYVCLHVRERGYKSSHHAVQDALNADIRTYKAAIERITARGGWVVRMGDPSMSRLPSMPRTVDYAHSPAKVDWLDIYLCATCRFYVGVSSGLAYVPPLFGVPCVLTNWLPTGTRPWHAQSLYIPKRYALGAANRPARFDEILSPPIGWTLNYAHAARDGLRLIDNTSEEIDEVVAEMLRRLDGDFPVSDDDIALQARFNLIAESLRCLGGARVGRDFLRAHRALLI